MLGVFLEITEHNMGLVALALPRLISFVFFVTLAWLGHRDIRQALHHIR